MGKTMYSNTDWARKRYARDPEYRRRRLELNRAWRAANREAHLERRRLQGRDPVVKEKGRARHYGISWQDYKAMAARQAGACAICKRKPGRTLHIDHCHSTGKVRGLLCNNCNSGLGSFDDQCSLLQAAAEYLEAFRGDRPQVSARETP